MAIFTSGIFGMLPPAMPNQSAFATFPGENGKIAFVGARDDGCCGEIWVMNADGSEQKNISNNAAGDFYPRWSPDGTKIAFYRDYSNARSQIYVMNADGSEQKNISNNAADEEHPIWSPDGEKIAFF